MIDLALSISHYLLLAGTVLFWVILSRLVDRHERAVTELRLLTERNVALLDKVTRRNDDFAEALSLAEYGATEEALEILKAWEDDEP